METENVCPLPEKQRLMHKDLFERINQALDYKFYLEAVFLEYSALEGRLEVMTGILNLPCNQLLSPDIRKDIKISTRIECLNKAYKTPVSILCKSKLNISFWKDLERWIKDRNMYMHGLFKNADVYKSRLDDVCRLAQTGYDIINALYKETNRLRGEQKKIDYAFISNCCRLKCKFLQNN